MKTLFTLVIILFGCNAIATETTDTSDPGQKKTQLIGSTLKNVRMEKTPDQSSGLLPQLLQVTFGLFVVVVVIGGAAWLARRFGQFHVAAHGKLRIVGGLHMGARERIVLIQVGDKQLLVGVAPGRIQTLHTLEENISIDTNSSVGENTFAMRLAKVMRGGK